MTRNIKAFLKLIRFNNLLMMAALQYAVLYCLVKPGIEVHFSRIVCNRMSLAISSFDFFLLVFSTILIAAAGYIINDIFDLGIDTINKPEKVIIDKGIGQSTANVLYWTFNAVGVLLGFYVSWKVDMLSVGFVFVFCAGLLWYYSSVFSRELLWGNIIVASLTAMLPVLVVVFQITPLNYLYVDALRYLHTSFNSLMYMAFALSYFAFLTNFAREVVKDMQDLEGDQSYGRNTLPVALGIPATKWIVSGVVLTTVVSLVVSMLFYTSDIFSVAYIIVMLVVPLVISLLLIIKASTTKHYARVSCLLKTVMLLGVTYLAVVYYNMNL